MSLGLRRHHNLAISSDRPFEGSMTRPTGGPDVHILTECEPGSSPTEGWSSVGPLAWRCSTAAGSWLKLRYEDGPDWVEFVIDPAGERVFVSASPDSGWADITELILGPVFSCLLSHRGTTCLHASVLQINGTTAAFVGAKGAGKSTLAAEFLRRGALLVSDDVAVLAETASSAMVSVGPPRIRVLRESQATGEVFDTLDPVWSRSGGLPEKRYLPAQAPDVAELRLDAVYFLAPRGQLLTTAVRPVRPAEAVPRLVANRHMADVAAPDAIRRDFPLLGRLAGRVRLGELSRPNDLSVIGECLDAVSADLASLSAGSQGGADAVATGLGSSVR